MAMAKGKRALFLVPLALLAIIGLSYAYRTALLREAGAFLVVTDKLERADIIFMLNGDVSARPFRAAELYLKGLATKIVIAREESNPAIDLGLCPNRTDVSISIIKRLGVPASDIVQLDESAGVGSTMDEARLLAAYARSNAIKRVIVVTSAMHTRRARWAIKRAMAGMDVDVQMDAAPHLKFDAKNWWSHEEGVLLCLEEYVKFVYYWLNY